jgi:hypothetical protein
MKLRSFNLKRWRLVFVTVLQICDDIVVDLNVFFDKNGVSVFFLTKMDLIVFFDKNGVSVF